MGLHNSLFPALHLLPKKTLSHISGAFAHSRYLPRALHQSLIRAFAKTYGVTLDETECIRFDDFKTFEDFFIRKLKPGVRPLEKGIVSPCDGTISQSGIIEKGKLTQIKGLDYDLHDLVGSTDDAKDFLKGCYATIYLSPRNYHRIHCPFDGRVTSTRYIPGGLWPVNETSVRRLPRLFCRNERVITQLHNEKWGKALLVFVGATIVGHIHISYSQELHDYAWKNPRGMTYQHNPPIVVKKGDEMGYFTLGSTVVLILEKSYPLRASLGKDIQYGRTLFDFIDSN